MIAKGGFFASADAGMLYDDAADEHTIMFLRSLLVTFKKSGLVAAVLFLICASASASDFCDGFKRGYVTGYKHSSDSGLAPLVPLCPLQPLKGLGDPKSDYEQGYVVGMQEGMADGA